MLMAQSARRTNVGAPVIFRRADKKCQPGLSRFGARICGSPISAFIGRSGRPVSLPTAALAGRDEVNRTEGEPRGRGYWSGKTDTVGANGSTGAAAPAATFCQRAPAVFVAKPRLPVTPGSIGTALA